MSARTWSDERGAALITVLMIVAAMSVVAVGMTQVVTNATQRARALDGQAQLRLYAAAAEEVAEAQLGALLNAVQGRVNAQTPGLGQVQSFPVDGGMIEVRAVDASNCFDLNGLVIGVAGGEMLPVPDAIADYLIVLEATGIDRNDAGELAAALVDWMDSDTVPGVGGAEDGYYAGERPAYRTSGRPLANLSELRAIRGYGPGVIAALRGAVCARPQLGEAAPLGLNLNTLTVDQVGVLSLAMSGAMEPDAARRLIDSRPVGGWPDIEAFMREPEVAKIAPELRRTERLGFVTTHVEVYAQIAYRGQMVSMQYLFETLPGQPVRTLRRERVG